MAQHDNVLKLLTDAGKDGLKPEVVMKAMKFKKSQQLHSVITRIRADGYKIKSPAKGGKYVLLNTTHGKEGEVKVNKGTDKSWLAVYINNARSLVSTASREVYLDRVHKEIENKLIEEAIIEANKRIIAIRTSV